ncbi:MAG: molybdate ABC transporter substrate-binding protein [Planctomycetes bacterium]|nr:molybdate ABC transporter substrate-binding protein [Planctomycetota bacterium]MCW8135861.1 molybdate ABC transporter substrate-binding protein [Planctomycetota bacterium]
MRAILLFALALLALAACGTGAANSPANKRPLAVAAAADLKFALDDVVARFEADHPDVDVRVTYGSSGTFHAQLTQKAPFDLYFSADIDYPQKLVEAGVADKDTQFEYAVGRIVIWVPNKSPIDVGNLRHEALLHPSVRKVAIANPVHAPYGRAAEAAMRDLGVYDRVKDRLVLGENIAQTAQFIDTGAANIGIIALSLAIAPQMKDKGKFWEIPLKHFPRMLQGGVTPKHARNPADAKLLRDYVTSEAGRAILRQYGFYMPED